MADDLILININLWEPVSECAMCDTVGFLGHAVAWCCGPTHDEIGSESSEYRGTTVGGMPVCKRCHDDFYGITEGPENG